MVMAGIQAAAGAAQIAAIRSTTKSGGGGGGAGGASSAPAAPAEPQVVRGVSITLQGENYSPQSVRNLISAINEQVRDGAVLTVS